MDNSEPLCDLRYVKAEYQVAKPSNPSTDNCFRIKSRSSAGVLYTFSITEKNAEQFAAELDVLTALIRARVMRARLIGEELN
jgi:hypothetical protein